MKNIFKVISLCIILIFMLTSCEQKTSEYKLEITCQPWDGWQEYTEEEMLSWRTVEIYEIEKGSKIEVPSGFFTITSIENDSITIKTDQPMSTLNAGIDMSSTQTVFELNVDEVLHLDTLWYDAGFAYELRLVQ